MKSLLLAAALLACAISTAVSSVGWKPKPRVEAEVRLLSQPELGRSFRVTARVKFLEPARRVKVDFDPPAGVEKVKEGPVVKPRAAAGSSVDVEAELRVTAPLSGAALKLVIRHVEDGPIIVEPLLLTRSLFLTVTEQEGREGLPGELWTRYLKPAPPGVQCGYVLADFGPAASFSPSSTSETALHEYALAVDRLQAGDLGAATRRLERLSRSSQPDLAAASGNALGVARSLGGDPSMAAAAWQSVLETRDLPDAIAGYIHYNRGVALGSRGDRTGAMAAFREALARHPGFSLVRRLLR